MALKRLYLQHSFQDTTGIPVGGYLNVYLANSMERATVYRDKEGTTYAPINIPLDSYGDAGEMWVNDAYTYKFICYDEDGVQVGYRDNVEVSGSGGGSGGLSEVSHDASMTGKGTSASPLGVASTYALKTYVDSSVSTESARATNAEGNLATSISAEAARAQSVEATKITSSYIRDVVKCNALPETVIGTTWYVII